jgi:two-component system, sensor histidine kinase
VSDTAAPSPTRWRALVAIVAVATAVLLGMAALQAQQLSRLNHALRTANELRVVEMHRQQTEYLQLREQWLGALDPTRPLDLRALTLRYDIWAGRVAMLKEDTATRRSALGAFPALDDALARVDAFIRQADGLMAAKLPDAARRSALAALHPGLLAVGDTVHDLALAAAHRATADQTARHLILAQHTRLTLALTAALCLLVLAFAALSLRQMRQLSRGQQTLHGLTTELRKARTAAESANQAKSRFLADMSHEMRTPFQGLLSMLSMLRDTHLDPHQLDYLRTATESADHLLAVLNDILDLSQLEAGRLQVNPATVDLRALVHEVESLMRPQAMARQLDLHVSVSPAVPELATLDGTRVKQVLFNLVSNGIKFCDRGSVVLNLDLQGDDTPAGRLQFTVTDTGPGMAAETLARLFNRFERGAAAGAQAPTGHGLGLEISLRLARLMGGDLQVSSEPGRGSRFVLTVPQAVMTAPPVAAPTAGRDLPAASQLQVLIAEDHPINRQVLAALLDGMGHRSHFVPTGDEALLAVQRQRFDLVLMDLHMPGLDGIEATRLIRALPDRTAATVPIVALTADAFTDTRERCLVAGMNDFLSKPVGREKLGSLLRQLFGSGAGVEPSAVRGPLQAGTDLGHPDAVRLLDLAHAERLRQSLGPDMLASLLADYFDQAGAAVSRLRAAVRDGQPLDLRGQAHAARGAALNLGLHGLAATAQTLHDGAAHLPAHEVARLVQRFEDQIAATHGVVRQAGLLRQAAAAMPAVATR